MITTLIVLVVVLVLGVIYTDWVAKRNDSRRPHPTTGEDFGQVGEAELTPMDGVKVAGLVWEFNTNVAVSRSEHPGWRIEIGNDTVVKISDDEAALPLRLLVPLINDRMLNETASRRFREQRP